MNWWPRKWLHRGAVGIPTSNDKSHKTLEPQTLLSLICPCHINSCASDRRALSPHRTRQTKCPWGCASEALVANKSRSNGGIHVGVSYSNTASVRLGHLPPRLQPVKKPSRWRPTYQSLMASAQVWFYVLVVLSPSFIPLPVSLTYSRTTLLSNLLATNHSLLVNDCTKRPAHNTLPSHQPMFVRWSGWWTIVAFTILVKWYRLSLQTWVEEGEPRSKHCTRGRTFTSAAVSNQGAFGPNGHGWTVTQAPAIPEGDLGTTGTHHVQDSGRCQRRLFSQIQTFPRWVELEVPSTPTKTRRAAAIERGNSVPIPSPCSTTATRIQLRYQSLLHEGEGRVSPLDKTYPFAPSTEEPDDSAASPPEQLSVFFVGVNNTDVEDPEHDAKAFETAFRVPSTEDAVIYFTSLVGADATLTNIKGWLIWLNLQATLNGSKMLVFLSGLGDAANRMCLSGDASISESDLCDWLSTTRTRLGLLHSKPVTIVTDMCREGKNPPRANPSDIVNLVWSCSLGQRSYAMDFENPAVPNSYFWLALFRACKSAVSSSVEFEATFLRQLDELGGFLLYSHMVWHKGSERCAYCGDEPGERCARPEPQVPDGSPAGWEGIYQLAAAITKNHHNSVTRIDTGCLELMKRSNFPAAADPPSSQRSGHTTRRVRGASHSVCQA